MKIYLVSTGEYSDYGIVAAFSTQEKAEELQHIIGDNDASVEEFDVNPKVGKYTQYTVFMKKDGNLLVESVYSQTVYFPDAPHWWVSKN